MYTFIYYTLTLYKNNIYIQKKKDAIILTAVTILNRFITFSSTGGSFCNFQSFANDCFLDVSRYGMRNEMISGIYLLKIWEGKNYL